MLLSHNRLIQLIDGGVINAPKENVNASSIDLTLNGTIMVEWGRPSESSIYIDISKKENIRMLKTSIPEKGYQLAPDQFILACSNEFFNLPNNISAEYKLKSSMARNGLEHLNAGWADAGWNGSRLTFEFKNMTQEHYLILREGMKIGQMVFFEHEPVPEHASYAVKGQYNNQKEVTESKELK